MWPTRAALELIKGRSVPTAYTMKAKSTGLTTSANKMGMSTAQRSNMLVGVSLGAFLVATPGALDERFRRVWLVQGAGEPADVFAHKFHQSGHSRWFGRLLANTMAALIYSHYLKPERWVGRIAPRPVIVINTRHDETFPASSVAALHKALKMPSEVIWAEGIGDAHENRIGKLAGKPGRYHVAQRLASN